MHVHHAFLYILLPSLYESVHKLLHDYDVKMPNFTFCGGRKHKTTFGFFFQNFDTVLKHSTPDKNCQQDERDGISAIKFEAAQIHFLKGHLQPVWIAVVHFTEINCCNTEITYVIFVFDNRIVSMFFLEGYHSLLLP